MVHFECPLCCAEIFPDQYSLKDHLLNISENIICPICELQFKSVHTLAIHLVDECGKKVEYHNYKESSRNLESTFNPEESYAVSKNPETTVALYELQDDNEDQEKDLAVKEAKGIISNKLQTSNANTLDKEHIFDESNEDQEKDLAYKGEIEAEDIICKDLQTSNSDTRNEEHILDESNEDQEKDLAYKGEIEAEDIICKDLQTSNSDTLNEEHMFVERNEDPEKDLAYNQGMEAEHIMSNDLQTSNSVTLDEEHILDGDDSTPSLVKFGDNMEIEGTQNNDSANDGFPPVRLFTCSVCNTTFDSVEQHLEEFHQDEHVVIDSHDIQDHRLTLNNEAFQESDFIESIENIEDIECDISDHYVITEDFLPNDTSSIWPQDEISTVMLGNWESEDSPTSQNPRMNTKSQSRQTSFVLTSTTVTEEGRWVLSNEGYYYAGDDTKEKELRERINSFDSEMRNISGVEISPISSFDSLNILPENAKKLPLATFVTAASTAINGNINGGAEFIPMQEHKPYVFRGHRVRLVTVKGGANGLPSMEEIPFPEKPPDSVIPFLEPAVDAPPDLLGTFAVMWPCNFCGYLDLHWSNLPNHKCSMLPGSGFFLCSFCSKEFQTVRSLTNHYNRFHKGPPNGRFKCTECPARVLTATHLEKHIAMHKKIELIKCGECDSMVPKSTIEHHLEAHQENGSLHLVCMLCNRPFKGKEELELHIPQCHLRETPTNFLQCTFCQNTFLDLASLRRHLVSHNIPIRPHGCSFCAKSFFRLIDKVVHERLHTKSRPHECESCGRCFRLRNSLISHKRIHTGERPFTCTECQKTFRTKHLLRTHAHVHQEKKEIKCSFCTKVFKCKDRAKAHENKHKTSFRCNQCARSFHSYSFMRKHMANHKDNKLAFTCNMCPNMFTRAAYLEKHLETVHGLDSATSISISVQKTFEQMAAKENLTSTQ